MQTFFTVYKITNKINNIIYIGFHKTLNVDDNFMSSSKIVKKAIEEFGKENFTKEILFIFDNEREMHKKEQELINEAFKNKIKTYNFKLNGKYEEKLCPFKKDWKKDWKNNLHKKKSVL